MAIFGTKQKTVKKNTAAQSASRRTYHAHAPKLVAGLAHDIIRAPWLSEKALIQTEQGIYTFEVSKYSTSAEIAGAIREIYNVTPSAVRLVNVKGKRKAMRTKRGMGQRAARRKAYVYLNAGDTISLV